MFLTIRKLIIWAILAILVHLVYINLILPNAEEVIALAKSQGLQSYPRNFFVIVKDVEQEICVIMMFWALSLMAMNGFVIAKDKYLFGEDLLGISESTENDKVKIIKAARENLDKLPKAISGTLLVKTLSLGLDRFLITRDVHSTSESIDSNVEALALSVEAENTTIRYLIWAIPSIGFIGTVRGIGQALAQADQALAGNIAGMASSLGVAFNSTFVALMISIFLMFFLYQLQRMQDGLIIDIRAYCQKHIMQHISR